MVMMTYANPYQGGLIEQAGYTKVLTAKVTRQEGASAVRFSRADNTTSLRPTLCASHTYSVPAPSSTETVSPRRSRNTSAA